MNPPIPLFLDPCIVNVYINLATVDKVIIEKLPFTRHVDGAKRWVEDKGEFVQIAYREDIGHIAFFQLRAGFFRGSHYHKRKEEIFYVVSGKIEAVFMDMDSQFREEHVLEKGDRIRVKTGCAHIFRGLEESFVIEYSPQYYDKHDAYIVDFGVQQ